MDDFICNKKIKFKSLELIKITFQSGNTHKKFQQLPNLERIEAFVEWPEYNTQEKKETKEKYKETDYLYLLVITIYLKCVFKLKLMISLPRNYSGKIMVRGKSKSSKLMLKIIWIHKLRHES